MSRRHRPLHLALTVLIAGAIAPSANASDSKAGAPAPSPTKPATRQLYFGDLHVHSGWSFDAFAAGVTRRPADAYTYARGGTIQHPTAGEIRLAGPPLDFIALTEHAEYLGLHAALALPQHPIGRMPIVKAYRSEDPERHQAAWRAIRRSYSAEKAIEAFTSNSVLVPAWRALIASANRHDEPGEFTAFVGFEYSPAPDGQNLHRNVLFRGDRAPDRPFSAMDSKNPEDLWAWMDRTREAGFELLAIPHNPNGSNGLMFATTRHDGSPIDADWIRTRARNEPVVEVTQVKGTSETHPSLSPEDEWADFEIFDRRTLRPALPSEPRGSYVRDALSAGLGLASRHGANPYRLGMVAGTDGHNASSPFEERSYHGKMAASDGTPEQRLAPRTRGGDPADRPVMARWGASGLSGVWATANERGAIFDAIARRETFATTGPRMRVRFYGGFDFEPGDERQGLEQTGDRRGVPMGGVLPRERGGPAPSFLIVAQADPLDAPLERIQIVKGWHDGERTRERIYDVACARGDPPDPATRRCPRRAAEPAASNCAPSTADGAAELRAHWQDPDDVPATGAFYYVRVLQIPTCRWSSWDALRLEQPPPAGLPASIQERAFTSPIWVEPEPAGTPERASRE